MKWFYETKSYGFIEPDACDKSIFVHIRAVERSGPGGLMAGQKISCENEADRLISKESTTNLKTIPFGVEQ